MGYACPVCETPQPDGEHLAHHLAFTAMLHGDEHESWLEEHAPGWGESGPQELAETVVEHAPETELPGAGSGEANDTGGRPHHDRPSAELFGTHRASGGLDDDVAGILREAQELTDEMLESDDDTAE